MNNNQTLHAKCKIFLLTKDAGGRSGYIANRYRPHISISSVDGLFSAGFEFKENIYPGDSGIVIIHFQGPPVFLERLKNEKSFLINEGSKNVGKGTILELINQ